MVLLSGQEGSCWPRVGRGRQAEDVTGGGPRTPWGWGWERGGGCGQEGVQFLVVCEQRPDNQGVFSAGIPETRRGHSQNLLQLPRPTRIQPWDSALEHEIIRQRLKEPGHGVGGGQEVMKHSPPTSLPDTDPQPLAAPSRALCDLMRD